jgi:hypothetical protein
MGGTQNLPDNGGSDVGDNGCPPIDVMLSRPGNEGGCTGGGGCHEPDRLPPDHISPGVGDRLLDLASSCAGRPYIGAEDSFLLEKIEGNVQSGCGSQMPLFMTAAISDETKACIREWAEQVAAGGG